MNIYMLLDRSGSMALKWEETVGTVNGYIEELAKQKGMKKAKVTLACFDSLGFDVPRNAVKIAQWKPISLDEFSPRGGTPLFDAIGKLDFHIREADPKKAAIAIITDGHENQSKEHTVTTARALVESWKKKDYDIVFLGADFDNFGQAQQLGGSYGQTMTMSSGGGIASTAASHASKTAYYASTGKPRDWTDEERKLAKGEK